MICVADPVHILAYTCAFNVAAIAAVRYFNVLNFDRLYGSQQPVSIDKMSQVYDFLHPRAATYS